MKLFGYTLSLTKGNYYQDPAVEHNDHISNHDVEKSTGPNVDPMDVYEVSTSLATGNPDPATLLDVKGEVITPLYTEKAMQVMIENEKNATLGKVPGLGAPMNGPLIQSIANSTFLSYKDDKSTYIKKGYNYNDIIYSTVKIIVDKTIIAPWSVYKVVDEVALKQLHAIRKQGAVPGVMKEIRELHHKALEIYNGDSRLNELIQYPNSESTLAKHHSALWTNKLVTGDYYELWQYAEGGLNKGKPIALDYLPPQYMNIIASRTVPVKPLAYQLAKGMLIDYDIEEILHEYYFNPDWDEIGSHLMGMSPCKALLRRIQRNNASQTAGIRSFENGGAMGVGYLDDDRIKDQDLAKDQKNAIQNEYRKVQRRGVDGTGTTIVSGYKVGFSQWGLSPKDQELYALDNVDARRIQAAYGVPSALQNDPDGKTYNNSLEGEKALTSRCALPLLNDREQSWNRKLRQTTAYKNSSLYVSYDMNVYRELQEDKGTQTTALASAWWFTGNEKREMQGETRSDNKLMDEILVPSGVVKLSDLDVNLTTDNSDDFEKQEDYV